MAAYLRHIAALTTWPGEAAPDRPIVIGVVGEDPHQVMRPIRARIGEAGLVAQGRPIQVVDLHLDRVFADADVEGLRTRLQDCDLLFLSIDAEATWARIEPLIGAMPVVTVSEMTGFARRGGMVEYFIDLDSGKVRMIVNLETMKRAGVLLSARLLALESVIVLRPDGEDV